MDFDVWPFIWENLEASGVIGGYVSISIIGVTLITFSSSSRLKKTTQMGPKWAQPIIGALLGVIPGCGGTIVASSMYKNRKLSFGSLLAAFITTLGEGSFVLLGASDEADVASNLKGFAVVTVVGLIVGVIVGSLADAFGFKGKLEHRKASYKPDHAVDLNPKSFARFFTDKIGFFLILFISIFLAPGSIMAFWGDGFDSIEELTVWVCVAMTLVSVTYYLTQRFVLKDSCHVDSHFNLRGALSEAVKDIAMVITYVFIGLVVANFIIDVLVGPEKFESWMNSSSIVVVIIAAFIGATPGCGGMIAVAVAYITLPNFPMAALIAGAIATSGDGIFPLLAENKKDALLITGFSLALALVVGFVALALGI